MARRKAGSRQKIPEKSSNHSSDEIELVKLKVLKHQYDTRILNGKWRGFLWNAAVVVLIYSLYRGYLKLQQIMSQNDLISAIISAELDFTGPVIGLLTLVSVGREQPQFQWAWNVTAGLSLYQILNWAYALCSAEISSRRKDILKNFFPVAALFFFFCSLCNVYMKYSSRVADRNLDEIIEIAEKRNKKKSKSK
mmetsp:Transcript_4302/g.5935  ORF Transcript_4302/g.5935 Transcript_4302/m.5935 type:complete len:194 (-) Transcript_4302:264-845(-)|eukprot:CAMPEP_0117756170 /NCGR_PEP_ID=MMETSP0947-20121206/13899_1 /TAXON_ID=44440 /ORGANISM="Chattonella subsalsa, Strain CCMP2191" /LENGTH=193 /DNA_ID=CAMNT_0005575667 /DNA_START=152 /DNA_END=733 /DNA_ORIENTATION=-